MTAIQIKSQLHSLIDNISDKDLLKKVYTSLKKSLKTKEYDFWSDLSYEERRAIEEGLAQADKGEVHTLNSVVAEGRAIYEK